MDLIVQLPVTKNGWDAIAVFVDRLSKMVHFAPTKTAGSAQDTAKIFRHDVSDCSKELGEPFDTD